MYIENKVDDAKDAEDISRTLNDGAIFYPCAKKASQFCESRRQSRTQIVGPASFSIENDDHRTVLCIIILIASTVIITDLNNASYKFYYMAYLISYHIQYRTLCNV